MEDPKASPKKLWALNFLKAVELLSEGKLKGYDENRMKLLPNAVPSSWGPDAGPNYSVVSAVPRGRITTDANLIPDDWTLVQPKAQSLAGNRKRKRLVF